MTPHASSRAASAAGYPIPVASRSLPPDCRGRLKNGNPSGDFLAAPRCAARTRCGGACRQPAMPNGRCRMHGGLGTGPRTAAGLANSRRARWKHGARSAEIGALRREARLHLRRVRTLLTAARTTSPVGARCARPSSPTSPVTPIDRAADPRARAARPYTPRSEPSAPAGHLPAVRLRQPGGVDRPFSPPAASGRVRPGLLGALVSAWHGVHRRFFARRAVVRSPAATNR